MRDSLDQLFEQQVSRTPQAIAYFSNGQGITYQELARQVSGAADRLIGLGVGPEVRVAVALERSLAAVVWILGVLKAGGAYVPMDPAYPAERLRFMAEDCGARLVLSRQAFRHLLGGKADVVLVDTEEPPLPCESVAGPRPECNPHGAAYIIYTSGSTGRPKGVVATHAVMSNRLTWMWREFPFEVDDVCCLTTSLSFVDSVWEIFGPLLQGVPCVIFADATVKDANRLVDAISESRVTRLVLVPSLLRALLQSPGDVAAKLGRLRICISSGEALPRDLAESFLSRVPSCRLLNLYGSSEVADATWHDVTAPLPDRVPIGRAIDQVRIHVLDPSLRPVPTGAEGEIYVSGTALARGYHGQPELTAQRFLPEPGNDPGQRMYRTGDRGRIRRDGTLEYIGRVDTQVKVRGFRVELTEIEIVLAAHPSVHQAIVAVRDHYAESTRARAVGGRFGADGKRLVAYVVPGEGHISASLLKEFLRRTLPEHMVPSLFVEVSAFPLTPSGKIDRNAVLGNVGQ
jgi:amino acid adenylation domain-containing protein